MHPTAATAPRGGSYIRTFAFERFLFAIFLLVALLLRGGFAHADEMFFYTLFPYDGSTLPLDITKIIYAKTMPELCAQRTTAEMLGLGPTPPNTIYVGYLSSGPPGGSCGTRSLNYVVDPPVVVTWGLVGPAAMSCAGTIDTAKVTPGATVPQTCVMPCPDDQKGPDGRCRVLSPKDAGEPCKQCKKPCPTCGNPINTGTGNKYQAETDLNAAIAGGLSLKRYYNSGRESPLTKVFGGYWQHNYSRKIIVLGDGSQAKYFTSGGAVLTFQLVGSTWTADVDIADVLLEIKNTNGIRTGWKYIVAANEDTENYDASGNPLSIQNRAGLVTTLVYSDGTNGASSGNG